MKHLITTPGPHVQYSINKIINSTYFRECTFKYRKIITSELLSLSHLKTAFSSVQSAHVNSVKMNELPKKKVSKIISQIRKRHIT